MFSTIGKKTRIIFCNLCSTEKFLVAVVLLFWGPDHSQVQTKIVRLLLQFRGGGGGGGARTSGWCPKTKLLWSNRAPGPETRPIKE